MVISIIYLCVSLASLYPFSLLAKLYERRINLELTLKELNDVARKLSTTSPQKEKKLRALRNRYVLLRKRISNFMIINLLAIWTAIFIGMILARIASNAVAGLLGIPPYINAPFYIPYVTYHGYLNDALFFLAIVLAYYPIHSRISGLNKLKEFRPSTTTQ